MLSLMFGLLGLIISLLYFYEWSLFYCGLMLLGAWGGTLGYTEGFYFFKMGLGLSVDLLSWSLIFLTFWIAALMILASLLIFHTSKFSVEFLSVVLFLTLFLALVFMVGDLLWFYVFFEGSLIPTLFLISGWGYQPERLKAGIYLFFYTMVGSLPLLLGIIYLFQTLNTSSFHLFYGEVFYDGLLKFIMMLAFLVKMPMFLVHLWLPSAHVEAPISGSMVLAGVLLKLGGYGLLRVLSLFPGGACVMMTIVLIGSLLGGSVISLLCLRQFDLSALIAYSSVVHMGLALGGLMVMSSWGFQGVMALMLGHGLCSSGLFACANIFYERGGTRSMLMNKGMISIFPSMMLWWFLLCTSNMAAPPSLNLLGEISLMISLVSWSVMLCLLLAGVSFFSAAYSLYLFSLVAHGSGMSCFSGCDLKSREYMLMVLHWVPLNIIIIKADLVFCWI